MRKIYKMIYLYCYVKDTKFNGIWRMKYFEFLFKFLVVVVFNDILEFIWTEIVIEEMVNLI